MTLQSRLPYCITGVVLCALLLGGCGSSDLEFKGASASSGQPANNGNNVTVVATSHDRLASSTLVDQLSSPQMVRIEYTYADGTPGLCSGTVVGTGMVLSAAHCFVGEKNGDLPGQIARGILVGNDVAIARATEVLIHPSFRADLTVAAFFNDIAILKVTDLPLPALAIAGDSQLDSSSTLAAYGFGQTEDGSFGTLRSTSVPATLITPNHIFSRGLCAGDSGGPLVQFTVDANGTPIAVIVGVGSSGFTETCGGSEVSLYTNLQNPEILSFIQAGFSSETARTLAR